MAFREKARVPLNRLVVLGNMDIQDGQDKQHEKLLRGKRIGCVSPHPNPRGVPFEWVKNIVFLRGPSSSFVCLRG